MAATDGDAAGVVPLYVLYGSQTGNCEQHAKDFCAFVQEKAEQRELRLQATHSQLDDFLELQHADFSRSGPLLVIIVSSYGVGQAPLGAYRFRDICNRWRNNLADNSRPLEGLRYAMCGLGDSKYTTFFENPTVIDETLQRVGAQRIGNLGKADASGSGDNAQDKVVLRWRESVVGPLLDAMPDIRNSVSQERLAEMQRAVLDVLLEVDPDYVPPESLGITRRSTVSLSNVINDPRVSVAVAAALVAVLAILMRAL